MMKQSTVPEIANLAKKHLDIEDYWNDTIDNIPIESDSDQTEKWHSLKLINRSEKKCVVQMMHNTKNKYSNENENNNKLSYLNLPVKPVFIFHSPERKSDSSNDNTISYSKECSKSLNEIIKHLDHTQNSLISPTFTCAHNEMLPASPNIYFEQNNYKDTINIKATDNVEKKWLNQDKTKIVTQYSKINCSTELVLQRYIIINAHFAQNIITDQLIYFILIQLLLL